MDSNKVLQVQEMPYLIILVSYFILLHHSCRRFVMGSNKVLQVALGKTPADELATNISRLSAKLAGQVGLLFTRLSKDEVRSRTMKGCKMSLHSHMHASRAG
jgi:hypothetical protein